MSVLFTDTDCEMDWRDVEKYDIKVLGMPYILDGEEKVYDMGKDQDAIKHFYKRVREGSMPLTAALNPADYVNYFEPIFKAGEDIFYIHFSDQLSGTFNYMALALNELKEKYPDRKVITFNTKNICLGAGLIVLEAAKRKKEGMSDEDLLAFLEGFAPNVACQFMVDSLAHLKRGGRISSVSAVIGGLLNIKPILHVSPEGKIVKIAAGNGIKKAVSLLAKNFQDNYIPEPGVPVYVMDADNSEGGDLLENAIKPFIAEGAKIERLAIGPVIGTHCGPGTVGVCYHSKVR